MTKHGERPRSKHCLHCGMVLRLEQGEWIVDSAGAEGSGCAHEFAVRYEQEAGSSFLYVGSTVLGAALLVYLYGIEFDSFSETELLAVVPVWLLPLAFGAFGWTACRTLRMDDASLQAARDLRLQSLWATGLIGGLVLLLVPSPASVPRGRAPLRHALHGVATWAVVSTVFLVGIFPNL